MSYSETVTKNDLKNIIEQVSAIDGTDMTQAEIEAFVEGLDVSGINAVDYIVEQGTSGNWTYRKWNSGIAEFWGYVVIPSVPNAWSSSGYTFNYPITLTQTSSWYVQQLNYQIEVTYLSNVGTNSAAIETKATSAVTNAQIRISFKGRWK